MTTPNLALPEVSASQSQKEVTINDTFARVDKILADTLDTDVTAGGTFVVSTANFQTTSPRVRYTFSGTPGADFTVEVPSVRRFGFFLNNTIRKMTLRQTSSPGATLVLMPGERVTVFFTGPSTNNAHRHGSNGHVAVRAFFPGAVAISTLLHLQVVERAFVMDDNFNASQGFAVTAPSGGAATFDVEKNGVAIGTIAFANGVATSTFNTTGSTQETFAVGDRLGIRSQATLSGIANVAVSLFAYPLS